MHNIFTVENIILLIMAIVIIIGIVDKIKKAKADDGKVSLSELFGILLSANGEISQLIKMAEDSTAVKTIKDKQKFIAEHLDDVIDDADFLTPSQKDLFKGFGMDNIAKLIAPIHPTVAVEPETTEVKKVVIPKKVEATKPEEATVTAAPVKPDVEEKPVTEAPKVEEVKTDSTKASK